MDEGKNRTDPTHGYQNQTFVKQFAAQFETQGVGAEKNPEGTDEPKNDSHREPSPPEALMRAWESITEHSNAIMAVFTILIFAATTAYTVIAILQWNAMRDSNEINRENVESVQRALVSFGGQVGHIKRVSGKKITKLTLVMPWENTGVTPSMNGKSRGNWKTFEGPGGIPDNYTYPDQSAIKLTQFEISPKGYGNITADVPIEWIQAVKNGGFRMFVYGWITYDDIFSKASNGTRKTPIHLSEFCDEITNVKSIPDDVTNPDASITWELSLCSEHNCTDERCADYAQKIANAP
jgi:hypothetical protein